MFKLMASVARKVESLVIQGGHGIFAAIAKCKDGRPTVTRKHL